MSDQAVCIAAGTGALSSGGQFFDVFFRFRLRLHIESPQFNELRQHLVNGECVECFEPFVRIVRDVLRISVLRHDVCDVLEHLKALDVKGRAFLIALLHRGLERCEVLVDATLTNGNFGSIILKNKI